MIYLCLGMTKSASTLVYQLTEEILRQAGRRPMILPPPLQRVTSTTNYFDTVDETLIDRIRMAAGGRDVVLKTHQRPSAGVAAMIGAGAVKASYAIRDPRELALSMVDHGIRSRRWGIRQFSECVSVRDCVASIDFQMESFALLAGSAGLLVLPYNETCFDTEQAVGRIAAQIGVVADPERVSRTFAAGRMTQQFNRGVPLRYREMSAEDSVFFLDRYRDFYADVDLALDAAESAEARSLGVTHPSGQLREEVVRLRRWLWVRLGLRL